MADRDPPSPGPRGTHYSSPAAASKKERENRGRKSSKNTRADRNKQLPREHVAFLAVISCQGEILLSPSAGCAALPPIKGSPKLAQG